MSYDTKGLTFLNSWGTSWGKGGFFTIESENVLEEMEFYDIYWCIGDLTKRENKSYLKD
jgi:C1A family cysteine protease